MAEDSGPRTRAHYERYPYPASTTLDWSPDEIARLNFFAGRQGAGRVPDDGRVLVAGCGAREACLWALQAPDAEVVGVDFSESSLERSARLAEAIALSNVQHRHADIIALGTGDLGRAFDLVVSFGVVHHLSDPATGLACVASTMAPDGLLLLMVYSTTHRRPVRELDDIAALLTPPGARAEERVERLVALARDVADFPGPLRDTLRNVLEFAERDVPALMDTYGHPNYHMYSIDQLWNLLESAGLRFVSWARPGDWRVDNYLEPGPVAEALASLPARARFDVIDRIFSPLFILYAERADRAERANGAPASVTLPYEGSADSLLDLVVRPGRRVRVTFDEGGRPSEPTPYGPTVRLRDRCAEVSFHGGASFESHPLLAFVLQNVDGRRTLGEAADAAAAAAGAPRAAVRRIAADALHPLLSPHEALVPVPE